MRYHAAAPSGYGPCSCRVLGAWKRRLYPRLSLASCSLDYSGLLVGEGPSESEHQARFVI